MILRGSHFTTRAATSCASMLWISPNDQDFLKKGQLIPLVGTPASLAFSSWSRAAAHCPDPEEFPADIMKQGYARGISSGCAVPLLCHDKIVGSMVVASLRESAFTEDDAELLTQIAAQVAIAVDNALAYERLRCAECEVVQERDRTAFARCQQCSRLTPGPERTAQVNFERVLQRIVPHDGAFFTLFGSDRTSLRVQALDLSILDQTPFRRASPYAPRALRKARQSPRAAQFW